MKFYNQRNRKKFITFTLCACMLLWAAPATAFAAEEIPPSVPVAQASGDTSPDDGSDALGSPEEEMSEEAEADPQDADTLSDKDGSNRQETAEAAKEENTASDTAEPAAQCEEAENETDTVSAAEEPIAKAAEQQTVSDTAGSAAIADKAAEEITAVDIDTAYKSTGDYLSRLADEKGIQVGSTGGDWITVGLARSGRMTETQKKTYYENVVEYVKENADAKEQLHQYKSTENSRIVVALTAAGMDPADVADHNLLKGLTDMDYLEWQGINGPIWALIAFDSYGYEIPRAADGDRQTTREGLIEYILGKQLGDGGWNLSGQGKSDPDITAMAIQSLAPYYNTDAAVKTAADKALTMLSEVQQDDGNYTSSGMFGGEKNIESSAQIVVALTALGTDPAKDGRFIKNGKSVLDAMLSYYVEGGGFRHVAGGGINGMATEQGYYALTAYERYINGQSSLYDMKPGKDDTCGDDGNGQDRPDNSGGGITNNNSNNNDNSTTGGDDKEGTDGADNSDKATEDDNNSAAAGANDGISNRLAGGKGAAAGRTAAMLAAANGKTAGRRITARGISPNEENEAEEAAAGWSFTGMQYTADNSAGMSAVTDDAGQYDRYIKGIIAGAICCAMSIAAVALIRRHRRS